MCKELGQVIIDINLWESGDIYFGTCDQLHHNVNVLKYVQTNPNNTCFHFSTFSIRSLKPEKSTTGTKREPVHPPNSTSNQVDFFQ